MMQRTTYHYLDIVLSLFPVGLCICACSLFLNVCVVVLSIVLVLHNIMKCKKNMAARSGRPEHRGPPELVS